MTFLKGCLLNPTKFEMNGSIISSLVFVVYCEVFFGCLMLIVTKVPGVFSLRDFLH